MEYRKNTLDILSSLENQCRSVDAKSYDIKQFMPSFSCRLKEFLEDYCNVSIADATDAQITKAVLKLAEKKGINLAHTTIAAWLKEDDTRDPSLNIEIDETRLNIYKLAALLDLDYSNTCTLFEKVFFARPFNPKSMQEIAFLYYASKCDKDWYINGVEFVSKVKNCSSITPLEKSEIKTDSRRILKDLSSIESTEALEAYLKRNSASFTSGNNNAAARRKIKKYADIAKSKSGVASNGKSISNDKLISNITGYNPRATGNNLGNNTALGSLPKHLRMKFPSGTILSDILAGRETSLISTYKMLVILLFYCYFKDNEERQRYTETDFRAFLNFANQELEDVGFSHLYPKQPFSGLILYCAAQEEPLAALEGFLTFEIAEASDRVIREKLGEAFSEVPQNTLNILAEICGKRNSFLTELICKNADVIDEKSLDAIIGCFDLSFMSDNEYMDYQEALAIRQLCICNRFTRREGTILEKCAGIIPGDGLDMDSLYGLFDIYSIQKLISRGWLEIGRDKHVYMDSHVKTAIRSCFLGQHLVDEYFIADSLAEDAHYLREPSLNRSSRKAMDI